MGLLPLAPKASVSTIPPPRLFEIDFFTKYVRLGQTYGGGEELLL